MTQTKIDIAISALALLHRTFSLWVRNDTQQRIHKRCSTRIFVCYNRCFSTKRTNERYCERPTALSARTSYNTNSLTHTHTQRGHSSLRQVRCTEVPQSESTVAVNAHRLYKPLSRTNVPGPYTEPLQPKCVACVESYYQRQKKMDCFFSRRSACLNFFSSFITGNYNMGKLIFAEKIFYINFRMQKITLITKIPKFIFHPKN